MKKYKRFFLFVCLSIIITVTHQTTLEAKGIRKAGTYFIEYGPDEESSETFRAHITYPKTILNYEAQVGIDAHDIVVKEGTLSTYSDQDLIFLADAHAWSMDTGEPIETIEVVRHNKSNSFVTGRVVEFTTQGNTRVIVNIYEQKEIYLVSDELYMNQEPVIKGSARRLSEIFVLLTIIPIILYALLFILVQKKKKEINQLLSQ